MLRCGEESCVYCGLAYEKFRTGLTFSEVRAMLWVDNEDSSKWKYKRRHTVLGLWMWIKQTMWKEHLDQCEQQREYSELEKAEIDRIVAREWSGVSVQEDSTNIPF